MAADLLDGAGPRMKGNVDERFTMNSYAKGLATMLQDSSLPVPLLMGVHGKYGSGKTRLIKNVLWKIRAVCGFSCSNLGRPMQSADVSWAYELCGCRISFFAYLLLLVVLFATAVGGVMSYMTWAGLAYHDIVHRDNSSSGSGCGRGGGGGVVRPTTAAPPAAVGSSGNAGSMKAAPNTAADGGVRGGNCTWSMSNDIFYPLIAASGFMGAGLLLMLVAVIAFYCHYCRRFSSADARPDDGWWRQLKLLLIMLLCETPPAPAMKKHDKVEVIPVVFNAWEYAGCDVLWAGIVRNIFDQVEAVFGKWKLRLYRTFRKTDLSHQHDSAVVDFAPAATTSAARDIESYFGESIVSNNGGEAAMSTTVDMTMGTESQSSVAAAAAPSGAGPRRPASSVFVHTAKWMHVPYPVVALLAASAVALSALVLILAAAASRDRDLHTIEEYIRLVAGVLLGLTALSQLSNGWSLLRSAVSSQSGQLDKAMRKMKGPDLTADLGFMHKVKTEVQRVTGFVKLMERLYQKKFRILIVIDDLDRCPAGRIRSILEAISILLSDEDSLFVTLIAIDNNAIARAIGDSGGGGTEADDSAEYLRRLVQMRFCIPEWTAADMETALDRSFCHHEERRMLSTRRHASGAGSRERRPLLTAGDGLWNAAATQAKIQGLIAGIRDVDAEAAIKSKLRRRMTKLAAQELRRHIDVLPTSFRDVRHLCHMVFFTVYLWVDKIRVTPETLDSLQQALADECAKLTWWVIMTEEWPYRISWILKHIEDMDEMVRRASQGQPTNGAEHERALLSEVYAHVRERVKEPEEWRRWISNDGSSDLFKVALKTWPLSVRAVKHFLPFTINLDRATKHRILEHCKTHEDRQCGLCCGASIIDAASACSVTTVTTGTPGGGDCDRIYAASEFGI